jgi:vacuolar protein sorting-associated protein 45
MTEALYSIVMSTRANAPVIRYLKSSDLCYRIADKLNSKLRDDSEFA